MHFDDEKTNYFKFKNLAIKNHFFKSQKKRLKFIKNIYKKYLDHKIRF